MSEMANTKERSGELARIAIAEIISLSQTVQAVPRSRLCLMK